MGPWLTTKGQVLVLPVEGHRVPLMSGCMTMLVIVSAELHTL